MSRFSVACCLVVFLALVTLVWKGSLSQDAVRAAIIDAVQLLLSPVHDLEFPLTKEVLLSVKRKDYKTILIWTTLQNSWDSWPWPNETKPT